MTVSIRQFDDGAWIHVADSRAVGAGEVRRVTDHDFCPCTVGHVLVEAFVDVGVAGHDVRARVAGQCIDCGTDGVLDWLTFGRVDGGTFRPVSTDAVQQVG
ncbi:hypothetical protein [Salinirarus marinus]|uniref:hypothetical protein n=1 Tax=Salinirarus marinus TaxID=3068310 RepID=UPI003C6C5700